MNKLAGSKTILLSVVAAAIAVGLGIYVYASVRQTTGTGSCTIGSFTGPSLVSPGETANLIWSTSDCTQVYLNGGEFGAVLLDPSGAIRTSPLTASTDYVLAASDGTNPEVLAHFSVQVSAPDVCNIKSFTADSTSISSGNFTTLRFTAANCTTVTLNGGEFSDYQMPAPNAGFVQTGALTHITSYTLSASGAAGAADPKTLIVDVTGGPTNAPCSILSFAATPDTIVSGSHTTLNYATENCTYASISGGGFTGQDVLPGSGTLATRDLTDRTEFTLFAGNSSSGNVSSRITVMVTEAASTCMINSFSASPASINEGQSTALNYDTANCAGVYLDGGEFNHTNLDSLGGTIPTSALNASVTYNLTAVDSAGHSVMAAAPVTVVAYPACVVSDFSVSPDHVVSGGTVNISYTETNCTAVTLYGANFNNDTMPATDPDAQQKTVTHTVTSGPLTISPTAFVLIASNPKENSTVTKQVTVTITQP